MLERISGYTAEQAKDYLLSNLSQELSHEKALKINEYETQLKDEADQRARNLISHAIQRVAADQVTETTVSVVPLPNDEMKGRIIGREGRNIRTIETVSYTHLSAKEATMAVAFYRRNVDQAKTHINYLRKIDGEWVSISDVEGGSESIGRVSFGDLNGDGTPEMMVGWSLYNTRNQKLALYFFEDTLVELAVNETYYTHMLVNEFAGTGRDDLLLFNTAGSDTPTSVKLLSYEDDHLIVRGTAELDAGIQRFGNSIGVTLSDTVNGVFVDCYKDPNTTITELIYWEDGVLEVPFYRPEDQLTNLTARESSTPCMDIDGDGMVEWPVSVRLPGYETADPAGALWKTTWMGWDYATRQSQKKFSCIMNERDGYYVLFDDSWDGKVTALYDKDTRLLQFKLIGEGDAAGTFLAFRASASSAEPVPDDGLTYEVLSQLSGVQYSVHYTKGGPFDLNMERIRYMFSLLPASR